MVLPLIFLANVDMESAFRIIPESLLGFRRDEEFYMDAVFPMGCPSSCAIFEEFSTALEWIAKTKLGITEVVYMLSMIFSYWLVHPSSVPMIFRLSVQCAKNWAYHLV